MLYLLRCLTCLSNLNVPLIFASCRNQSSSSRVTMESSLLSSRRQTLICLTKEITLRKTMLNKWSTSILRLASIPKMFGHKASTQMMSFTGKLIPFLTANVVALSFSLLYSPMYIYHLCFRVQNTDFDQAVALDGEYEATEEEFRAWHDLLKENGVKIVAPPMWMREFPSLFICCLKIKH